MKLHRILRITLVCIFVPGMFLHAQRTSTLEVDGAKLFVREFGTGTPVVIVGGIPGASADYLVPMAQEFGKRYRTFLIDMRGTGGSTLTRLDTGNVNLRRVGEDLEALRRHSKLTNWVVVSHGFGGAVALTYTSQFPASVRGLLLVGPSGVDGKDLEVYRRRAMARMSGEDSALYNEWRHISNWSPQRPKARLEQLRAVLGGMVAERRVLPALRTALSEHSYIAAVSDVYGTAFTAGQPALSKTIMSFKNPSIIIQGDQDPVDRAVTDRVRGMLKNSRFKEVRGSGAFPWMEKPKEFWSAADAFLKTLRR